MRKKGLQRNVIFVITGSTREKDPHASMSAWAAAFTLEKSESFLTDWERTGGGPKVRGKPACGQKACFRPLARFEWKRFSVGSDGSSTTNAYVSWHSILLHLDSLQARVRKAMLAPIRTVRGRPHGCITTMDLIHFEGSRAVSTALAHSFKGNR